MDGENFGFFYELRASNDVRTNGAERRLVLGSLRQRVELQACKDERR